MDKLLSPYLCGYIKGYSVQHTLITLLGKWRISLDDNGFGGAIFVDLSKAFVTLNNDLLIANSRQMLQIQNNRICKFHWLIFMIK